MNERVAPSATRFHLRRAFMIAASLQALGLGTRTLAQTATPRRATDLSVLVLYPEIGEPYRTVFSQIIEGIQQRTRAVATQRLTNTTSLQEIQEELRRSDAQVIIALGRNGLRKAQELDARLPIIAGAVLQTAEAGRDEGVHMHSLTPDPALLFARLRQLAPTVRRVHVIYSPAQNNWLVRSAIDPARQHGLELVRNEASDLRSGARSYHDTLGSIERGRDALWLVPDSLALDESATLSYVLEESWNRNLVVFSSSIAHVRRGALFTLYPNNVTLGNRLAAAASEAATRNGSAASLHALQDVVLAVNLRTAGHLGLQFTQADLGNALIFPTP